MPIQLHFEVSPDLTPQCNSLDCETISLEERNAGMVLNDVSMGLGTLFLSTRRLYWQSMGESSKRVAIDYPDIILHAISRGTDTHPDPCIYCQLSAGGVNLARINGGSPSNAITKGISGEHTNTQSPRQPDTQTTGGANITLNDSNRDDEHDDGESDIVATAIHGSGPIAEDDPLTELRFVLASNDRLEDVFRVLSEMAALNPDPNQDDSDDEFDNEGWMPTVGSAP